jgi:DNA-binding MarR family transcriptional regulator
MVSCEKLIINVTDEDRDYDLYLLFSKAQYLTWRAREKELQRYRITPEQAQLYFAIKAMNDEPTVADLSRVALRKPHSISALVTRMEKKGLIDKTKDPKKNNQVRVALTEKGEKAYEKTEKRGPIHRIMSSLDDAERESFMDCLEKILKKARTELGMDSDYLPALDSDEI